MKKISIILVLLLVLITFCACSAGPKISAGVVIEKYQGEPCLVRLGKLTITDPTQPNTGYVLVIKNETETASVAVSQETYYTVSVGEYVNLLKED